MSTIYSIEMQRLPLQALAFMSFHAPLIRSRLSQHGNRTPPATHFKIEATWQSSPHLLPGFPVGAHSLLVIDAIGSRMHLMA